MLWQPIEQRRVGLQLRGEDGESLASGHLRHLLHRGLETAAES